MGPEASMLVKNESATTDAVVIGTNDAERRAGSEQFVVPERSLLQSYQRALSHQGEPSLAGPSQSHPLVAAVAMRSYWGRHGSFLRLMSVLVVLRERGWYG